MSNKEEKSMKSRRLSHKGTKLTKDTKGILELRKQRIFPQNTRIFIKEK